jgi:hypothetical protein
MSATKSQITLQSTSRMSKYLRLCMDSHARTHAHHRGVSVRVAVLNCTKGRRKQQQEPLYLPLQDLERGANILGFSNFLGLKFRLKA